MSAVYRVLVSKASTGANLAELPWSALTFSKILSGCGEGSMTLPQWHPSVTESNLGIGSYDDPDREITIWRDDVAVMNGPITATRASRLDGTVAVTFREASWWFGKRIIEADVDVSGEDIFDGVRAVFDHVTTKTATGDDGMTAGDDIVAALPRFTVASGLAGATFPAGSVFGGTDQHSAQEALELLAADPETGFEWRMDYATSSTRTSAQRTLVLGYPSLGVTWPGELTERVLQDFSRVTDGEQGATRVHVKYSGGVKTLQNSGAVANGVLLTEYVDDLADTTNHDFAVARARDQRRLRQPQPRTMGFVFHPTAGALDFDSFDLGDTVPFQIAAPDVLSITSNVRRVVQLDVTAPGRDSPELVAATCSDPLSTLGA